VTATPPLLLKGNCLDVLRELDDNSIDSIVTDPPYGLANTDPKHVVEALTRWAQGDREFIPEGKGFMGKSWDAFVPPPAVWDECLRVLKPGGHLLAFAGSRTFDLMTLSIRFAGFEIRDSIAWLYGSGFPKSMNVGKAITGHESGHGSNSGAIRRATMGDDYQPSGVRGNRDGVTRRSDTGMKDRELSLSENGQKWEGWGTALKPAFEPIVVARKPLAGTVAANVLAHGTGALNIDASRIEGDSTITTHRAEMGYHGGNLADEYVTGSDRGRWPANVILDESQAAELDGQSGTLKSGANPKRRGSDKSRNAYGEFAGQREIEPARGADAGGASRFFYVAKAPKSERPVIEGVAHPTVKPLALMRWLITLVTPSGGLVVDPFAGSGTTLEAAYLDGFESIVVEMTPDYWPLIEARIARATKGDWTLA
jgi:DNA modification methylase